MTASTGQSLLDATRKGSMVLGLGQVASSGVGFATTIVLARYLTVSEYGIYNLITGSLVLFSLLTGWGLGSALQRFVPEYARTGQYGRLFRLFFFSQAFRASTGVLAIALSVAYFDPISRVFNIQGYKSHYALFCIGAYAYFQIEFLQITFSGLLLQKYSSLSQLGYLILRLLTVTAFLTFGGSLAGVFAGEICAYVFGCLFLWYLFIYKVYRPLGRHSQDDAKIERRRVWSFSLLSAATIPGNFLFSHAMDYFIVAAMATTNQLGIYALGSRASNMLLSLMPQNLMQAIVRPVFYHRYYSVDERASELNRMFRSLLVLIAAVLFPALALASVHAEEILGFVFKSKFSESTPVFLMLLAFNAFTILELPSDLVLQSIEKVQARLYAQVFAIYNVVLAVLLMPNFGLLGVAFATGSAKMGKCLFWYYMAQRFTGISICWSALGKIVINTAVAAGAAYGVRCFGVSPVCIIASLVIGATVYAVMGIIIQFLDAREKELVNRFCKRRLFKL